jgi:hypothetical protein
MSSKKVAYDTSHLACMKHIFSMHIYDKLCSPEPILWVRVNPPILWVALCFQWPNAFIFSNAVDQYQEENAVCLLQTEEHKLDR